MAKVYKSREIEELLQNKFGFQQDESHSVDHRWYTLQFDDLPAITTKFSHGPRKDIRKWLEGKIAKDLHVRTQFFREMVGCTKDTNDYHQQLRDDPYPPFR